MNSTTPSTQTEISISVELEGGFSRAHSDDRVTVEVGAVGGSFDLGAGLKAIPDKLFFRIGEVAELLDLKTYVLRFWETEFPMVAPTKSDSGQRVYKKSDVEMLMLIRHLLYIERFSIEGARKKIRELRREGELSAAKEKVVPHSGLSGSKRKELRALALELRMLAGRSLTELFHY